jgi:hypothetical protein
MRLTKGVTMGRACTCRYRNILSDRQRPSRQILSVSTSAHNRAMAPLERSDLTDISEAAMPTVEPRAVAVTRRGTVNTDVHMGCHVALMR